MSDLVAFDDLGTLDAGDLRAVFDQVPRTQVVDALAAAPPHLRKMLLSKLGRARDGELPELVAGRGAVDGAEAAQAQQAIVHAMRRLARNGIVAFDDPDDITS